MRRSRSHFTITDRSCISLQLYFRDIQQIEKNKPVKKGSRLAIAEAGRSEKQSQLILNNLRFVITIAKQYQYTGIPLEDLISQGNLGLITAATQYQDVGHNFISYAVWWIREALTSAAADYSRMIRLPANRIWLLQKIIRTQSQLEQVLGREPLNAEIALELGIAVTEVNFVLGHNPVQQLIMPSHNDSEANVLESLPDLSGPATDQLLEANDVSEAINYILSILDDRERQILEMVFGLEERVPVSLETVATRLGLTSERVRQIKSKAIIKIRQQSVAYLKQLEAHI